jgi:hypothetical protein
MTMDVNSGTRSNDGQGPLVYWVACCNPGCGSRFQFEVTGANVWLLRRSITCPGCRRPGGALKHVKRLDKLMLSATLTF